MVVDDLLRCMKVMGDDTIQRLQLKHRLDLAAHFGIEEGMKVLEIGCGQGDTTVALASAVGENGHVTALDIADAEYGAPITLGEATEAIQQSKLGDRITFHLSTEFLAFPENKFDVIVLSHCSWYFKSTEKLQLYLDKAYRMTERICIAEWNVSEFSADQLAHLNAVQILALYSEFVDNDGNIQHLFSSSELKRMLKIAGWKNFHQYNIDAHYLQDGKWEIEYAKLIREEFDKTSSRIQILVNTLYEQLYSEEVKCLNSTVLTGSK